MSGIRSVWAHVQLLWKRRVHIASDVFMLALAFVVAYALRFEFSIPPRELAYCLHLLPYVVAVQLMALVLSGVYMYIWRYIGLRDVKAFAMATIAAAIPVIVARFAVPDSHEQWHVPLAVTFIDALLMFGTTLGARVMRRAIYEYFEQPEGIEHDQPKRRVLLIGAGRAGKIAVDEIRSRRDSDLEIVGFVDDARSKQGFTVHNLQVLGPSTALPSLVREFQIDHVIITFTSASRERFREILDICESIPVRVRTIPSLYEVMKGNVKVSRIRDLEIGDLLGREEVQLDDAAVAGFLRGKVVMVTGAGGSIGSELARQIVRYDPATLLLVERAEPALFPIHSELKSQSRGSVVPIVADIGNEARMEHVFSTYRPEVVIHAAAHKHVPMMESNTTEAVTNNVIATERLAQLSGEYKAEAFVLISSDKAVRPTSVMGATKRVGELMVQSFNAQYDTRFVAVRFGNVIGSTGSVIPIFYDQIRKGGPVTVTHPEMVRYFMTIPEASQLVLQAAAMASGGEIFVLDMGQPVKILDLAKDVIRLAGLRPDHDIEIVFTGIREGEKLYEELNVDGERMGKTRHPKIFIGEITSYPVATLRSALRHIEQLTLKNDDDGLVAAMQELLPEARLTRRKRIVEISTSTAPGRAAAAASSFD